MCAFMRLIEMAQFKLWQDRGSEVFKSIQDLELAMVLWLTFNLNSLTTYYLASTFFKYPRWDYPTLIPLSFKRFTRRPPGLFNSFKLSLWAPNQ